MKSYLLLVLFLSSASLSAQVKIQKLWETDTTQLRTPESVLWDPKTSSLYVTNIDGAAWNADKNGFISTMSTNGTIQTLRWVTGLNAPKGMGIAKGKMYVADITDVAVIDVYSGAIVRKIQPEGAKQLNDVAISPDGDVYVSDSGTGRIYLIKGKKASIFLESPDLQRPNGLKFVGNRFFVITSGSGLFYEVKADKSLVKLAEGLPSGDGIESNGDDFILSRWEGIMHYLHADGKLEEILDLKSQKKNTADIGFDPVKKIIYVPTFNGNTVAAYQLITP
ncbi:MAG: SMP-30/gluconolactonase/LRE family protein [Siphonobacter sp.]